MSRAHSTFIPAEQVENATDWNFTAVDQAALRFAAKLRAQELEEERQRDDSARKSGHAEGYSEGYAAGFAQGHAQATLEGQKQISEYIANQGQEAAQRFLQLFMSAQTQLEENEQNIARGALELACEVARQVLRAELSVNPNALPPVVREALGMLTADTRAASVRLNPADLDVIGPDMQRDFPNLALTLVPDASISAGGCLVEAAGSVIDGTIERRWNKALSVLGLDAAWETGAAKSDD